MKNASRRTKQRLIAAADISCPVNETESMVAITDNINWMGNIQLSDDDVDRIAILDAMAVVQGIKKHRR